MKILCGISGIPFTCEHFPLALSARECYHPVFHASQKKLLSCLPKWVSGELTDIDSYLLFLALLNSTDLIEWRVPVERNARTSSIIANNMEPLVKMVGKINLIKHPAFVLSKIAITSETKYLDTSRYWIQNWEQSYSDFNTGYKNVQRHDRLVMRERALEKIILDPQRKDTRYLAKQLAEWAADAGCFPTHTVLARDMKMPTSQDKYWKELIIRCINEEQIFTSDRADLSELIEHCEDNIEAGTIYHYNLMKILRDGLNRKDTYLGAEINAAEYRILDAETSIEDANKLAMIAAAPDKIPVESDYPSKIAYLRAKARWDMKVAYESKVQS